jgi:hypothetical protein
VKFTNVSEETATTFFSIGEQGVAKYRDRKGGDRIIVHEDGVSILLRMFRKFLSHFMASELKGE